MIGDGRFLDGLVVTFNGTTFDLPVLLATRNGIVSIVGFS
jgi:uncharacterized protein YprB with RNaseH-like and TPR domain